MSSSIAARSGNNSLLAHWALVLVKMDVYNEEYLYLPRFYSILALF